MIHGSPYCTCQYLMGDVSRVKRLVHVVTRRGQRHGVGGIVESKGEYRMWCEVPMCGRPTMVLPEGRRLPYCETHAAVCYTAYGETVTV